MRIADGDQPLQQSSQTHSPSHPHEHMPSATCTIGTATCVDIGGHCTAEATHTTRWRSTREEGGAGLGGIAYFRRAATHELALNRNGWASAWDEFERGCTRSFCEGRLLGSSNLWASVLAPPRSITLFFWSPAAHFSDLAHSVEAALRGSVDKPGTRKSKTALPEQLGGQPNFVGVWQLRLTSLRI